MKKVLKVENLCCANCAQKMERGILKIDGVIDASVNFIMQKITIEAEDSVMEPVVEKAISVCRKIESDCVVIK